MISFADLNTEMLTNPEVAAEYERLDPVYALVGDVGTNPAPRAPRRMPESRS